LWARQVHAFAKELLVEARKVGLAVRNGEEEECVNSVCVSVCWGAGVDETWGHGNFLSIRVSWLRQPTCT